MAAPHSQAQIRKRVSAMLAEDRPDAERVTEALGDLRQREGAPTFSVVLQLLAHLELPEARAERVFRALLRHRESLARSLGRDPGLRVAAVDFLSNVEPLLTNPTIVEAARLERTERSAVSDPLTGLGNRRRFSDCLALEVRRSSRYRLRLSLLLLDLDEFKQINDRHGHLVGDLVLERVGRVLRRAVREADIACRFGGEEFAVVLPETDRLGALAVGERIRTRIEREFADEEAGEPSVRLRLSGGIASYPDDAREAGGLIDCADRALYLAKREGKNRISIHHAERRQSVRYPAKESSRASLVATGETPHDVRPVNLSRQGALLRLPRACRAAERLELTFGGHDPSGRACSWVCRGRVVRIDRPERGDDRLVAVRFDEPLDEDCLEEQIRRSDVGRTAVEERA